MAIYTKRAYEKPESSDGYRVLVDALWPRGMSKEKLKADEWMREIAPSPGLRTWYGHRAERWKEFGERYRQELEQPERQELLKQLLRRARKGRLTLVFGARDASRSNAAVLAEVIQQKLSRMRGG